MLTKEFIKMGSVRNAMQSLNRAAALDPKNPEVTELLDLFTQGFH
jgi:Flp pilus assembly protein TadD